MDWLKEPVFEYIKNTKRPDSVDITTHFKLRADITLAVVAELVKEGRVIRWEQGIQTWYEVL